MKIIIRKAAINRAIILFCVLLLGLKPSGLVTVFPGLDSLFDLGRVICVAVVGVLYIFKRKKPSTVAVLIYFLYAFFLGMAYLYDKYTTDLLINCISMFLVIGVIDVFGDSWEDLNGGLFGFFEVIIYANFITLLMGGINNKSGSYLLGSKNELLLYIIPAALVSLIRINIKGKNLRSYALAGICIASVVMAASATAIVSTMVFLLIYALLKSGKRITAKKVFAIGIVVDLILTTTITVLQETKAFSWFVSDVLNKSTTLSGRDAVWRSVAKHIIRQPILGSGYGATVPYEKSGNMLVASHAHNQYLQMLLIGGVIAFLLFVAINILSIRRIDRVKSKNTTAYYAFVASLAAMFTAYMTEAYTKIWWIYIVYILAYYYFKTAKAAENEENVWKR